MSDLTVYVGCYFELPKKVENGEWDKFISKYENENFDNDFTLIDNRKVLLNEHNKFSHFFEYTSENFSVEINQRNITLAEIYFTAQSKQLFEILKRDYDIVPEIVYGAIPYYD